MKEKTWIQNLAMLKARIKEVSQGKELPNEESIAQVLSKIDQEGITLFDLIVSLYKSNYLLYKWNSLNHGKVFIISKPIVGLESKDFSGFYKIIKKHYIPGDLFRDGLAFVYAGKSVKLALENGDYDYDFKFFLSHVRRIVFRSFQKKDDKGKYYRYYLKKLANSE